MKMIQSFIGAIRKYGANKFSIQFIEICATEMLDNKEIQYIKEYDSFNNGYNSTIGGSGTPSIIFNDSEILNIINRYIDGDSTSVLAEQFNVSTNTIKRVISSQGIKLRTDNNEAKKLVMFSKSFEYIRYFNSKREVVDWISNNSEYSVNLHSIYGLLTKACKNGNIAYGHRWQLASDLVYDGKIFRTKFDKEAYIQGKPAYQPEGKQYYIVDNTLDNYIGIKHKDKCISSEKRADYMCKKYCCKICNKEITKQSKTGMCSSCANVVAKGKSPKPSKEHLQSLLINNTIKDIAKMYNRTKSTVCAWINKYELR